MEEEEEEEEEDYKFHNKRKRGHGRDKNDGRRKTLPLKVRELNPLNTISYVQVLGTGMDTQDTSPSVLLFFDNQRFIFNAGEGLQRFCTEHKIKLSKIDHIFLSRFCSETAGGLPGLLLTLDGMGDGVSVDVWGPSDLEHLKNAMGSFIPQAAILRTHSFGSVSCSNGVSNQEYEILKEEATSPSSQIENGKERSPSYKAKLALKHQVNSVIYVCELHESKGKFDPKKAAALGLKPGPKYRELQLGNSVKSDHQDIMVHPTDVMGPSVIGPIVLLVDCPTLSHVRLLLYNQSLDSYYTDVSSNPAKNSRTVNCVIHLSPAFVVDNSDYRMWMSRFVDAKHVLAGHVMKNMEIPILKSSARLAARLNYVCPQFFPAPGFWSLQHLKHLISGSKASNESPVRKPCEAVYAENLLKFNLRPHALLGLDRSGTPAIVAHSDVIDELISEIPESVNAAQRVSQLWKCGNEASEHMASVEDNFTTEEPWLSEEVIPSCLEGVTRDDMEIILLGTVSSQPSKYRNVTSIVINLFSKGSLLLDCGEGTLGQLKRRFGIDGADDAVRGLRCIWISHIHADHHTGLVRILALRRDLLMGIPHAPLLVIGPCPLKIFLNAYQKLEDLDMQFLDCQHTMEASLSAFESDQDESHPESLTSRLKDQNADFTINANGGRMRSHVDVNVVFPLLKKLKIVLEDAGLKELISFRVSHCEESFGVALKAAERVDSFGKRIPGWKIVYSGDTRPCCETVKASYGATVLIHEATFEDKLLAEAVAKRHSTTKEAIEVGVTAGVYRIILTHFSQRYPKIPALDRIHMDRTCVAFDMMSVNLADLQVLPKVLPYLQLLFKDEVVTEELDDGPEVATVAV